jgi:hypothetical protein
MAFPNDPIWQEARRYLERHMRGTEIIMAPTPFLEVFPGACHYHTDSVFPPDHFRFVVFHVGMFDSCDPAFIRRVVRDFQAVFLNEVFAIYRQRLSVWPARVDRRLLREFLGKVEALPEALPRPSTEADTACIVPTYNRPWALARTLPQVIALGAPVLVVDDGSAPEPRRENAGLCERHGARLLALPTNRGLCCVTNVAISYWLADSGVQWISLFEDDVDVRPDAMAVLAAVQDARERPFLTGRYAPEHPVFKRRTIAGHEVLYQRSTTGMHNHAHRDYWAGVMPLPTPYLGAPKPAGGRPGQGSEEDWWVTAWSPDSIVKRGGYVVCVPGLVRHAAHTKEQSTWGGGAYDEANPPLGESTP